MHIATEETKFGLDEAELEMIFKKINADQKAFDHVSVKGLMGMASFTEDNDLIKAEFKKLKQLFEKSKTPLSIIHYPFYLWA